VFGLGIVSELPGGKELLRHSVRFTEVNLSGNYVSLNRVHHKRGSLVEEFFNFRVPGDQINTNLLQPLTREQC